MSNVQSFQFFTAQTKHFPFTEQNASSLTAAVYVHCSAEQNKFVIFQNLVWDRQSQWDKFYDAAPLLDALAKEAKLNPDKLAQCLSLKFPNGKIEFSVNGDPRLGISQPP